MDKKLKISFIKLDERAKAPVYGSPLAAGADLRTIEAVEIKPKEMVLIHTGLAIAIPEGFGGFIFARSGLATKRLLAPANKVGVIDADYRGEIMVPLFNNGSKTQYLEADERVAQLVLLETPQAAFIEMDELDETARNAGGFGSTGIK